MEHINVTESYPGEERGASLLVGTPLSTGVTGDAATAGSTMYGQNYTGNSSEWPATLADFDGRRDAYSCGPYKLIVSGVLCLVVIAAGFAGNTLTVFTLWPSRNKTSTAFLLITLACLDNATLCVVLLNAIVPAFCNGFGACAHYMLKFYAPLACVIRPLGSIVILTSTWVIVLVTAQRYISVCHPTKYNRWCKVTSTRTLMAFILIFSLLYNLVRFFVTSPMERPSGEVSIRHATWMDGVWYKYIYNLVLTCLLLYLVPFLLLTYMTYKLIATLKVTHAVRNQLTTPKREEWELNFTLVIIVVVFMVGQLAGPLRRLFLILVRRPLWADCRHPIYYAHSIFDVIVAFNHSVNVIIYVLCARQFRSTLVKRLCDLCRRRNKVTPVIELQVIDNY